MMRPLMILAAGLAGLALSACSGGNTANESGNALTDGGAINRMDDATAGANAMAPLSGNGTVPPNAQNGTGATDGSMGAGTGTTGGTGGDTGSMTGTGVGESGQAGGTETGTGGTSGTRTTPGGGT